MATAAILKNLNTFTTDSPILTKFGVLMRLSLWTTITNKISRFQKSKMAVVMRTGPNWGLSAGQEKVRPEEKVKR